MPRRKTGFDKFFDEQMKAPGFAAGYADARAIIDGTDRLVRALDSARVKTGMSKAELARLISVKPEIVRRLFTVRSPNPTIGTVSKIAGALGLQLELVRATPRSRPRGTRGAKARSSRAA
jgi:ribosome-binding protein aMBF1 (putative translation factor)